MTRARKYGYGDGPRVRQHAAEIRAEPNQQEEEGIGDEAQILPQIIEQPARVLGHAHAPTITAMDKTSGNTGEWSGRM